MVLKYYRALSAVYFFLRLGSGKKETLDMCFGWSKSVLSDFSEIEKVDGLLFNRLLIMAKVYFLFS